MKMNSKRSVKTDSSVPLDNRIKWGLSSKMCKFIFFPYRQFSELPVLYARINTVHT